MEIRVDCPFPLPELQINDMVQIKKYISHVNDDGDYLGCIYNGKCIGMCEDIEIILKGLSEGDYLEGKVIYKKTINYSTSLKVKLL